MTPQITTSPPARSPSSDGAAGTIDVVYILSTATWQAAWRRGLYMPEDRLVTSLLASARVGRLLICNHARSAPLVLARRLSGSQDAPFPDDDRTRLIQPLRLRRHDPVRVSTAARAARAYDGTIARRVAEHGLVDPAVIVAHPHIAGLACLSWARSVTWYATDDWASHPGYRQWWDVYRETYQRVREHGRRVAAISSVLHDRIAPTGPSIVVPNGLDPDEWMGPITPPAWVAARPSGPLLVYAGTLDSRIDVPWMQAVARARPAARIILVGPLADPAHLAPLRACENIEFRGNLGRTDLTGLIRSADAGLLPHRATPLTEAMSPLKVLEYLAAGIPVAATDLPPVRELRHPAVVLAAPGGDYLAAVDAALDRGRASEPDRLAFLSVNSWRARHDHLLDLSLR
jgi:teichuronic acid biosynthesis glycosyltransferase TuaH